MWSSSDVTVASVVYGEVTPLAVGTATITVTTIDGEFTDTCTVTVAAMKPVELVEIFSEENDILFTLRDITNPEPMTDEEVLAAYIPGLTAADFILVKGFGTPEVEVIEGINFLREDGYGTWEGSIIPVSGTFAPGNYRLGFSREGYDTAHIDVVIEETPVANVAVSATEVYVGDTLANSSLSGTFKNALGNAVAGTLAWDDVTTVVNASGDFAWTFTPTDMAYNMVTGTVEVVANPVLISAISVSGDAVVGQELTAVPDPADATGTYQWMRCDTVDGLYVDIVGATAATYTLVDDDAGKYIKVSITGTGNYTGTVTSDAIVVVGIFVTPIEYIAPSGVLAVSNTVALFGTTFADAAASQNLANWTIDMGTTNLQVDSITRTGDNSVTIDYTVVNDGQGTGEGTITIQAKAAAVESGAVTNVTSVEIIADTTVPVIVDVADADVAESDIATWEAPTTTASDDVDGDISGNIVVAYTSADEGSAVSDLTTARTHLATLGNTVTVTYKVDDAAGNSAVEVTATFTSVAD